MNRSVDLLLVQPEATLRDTLGAIDRGARGVALVVSEDRTLVGLVTDGDIRRALLAGRAMESPAAIRNTCTGIGHCKIFRVGRFS